MTTAKKAIDSKAVKAAVKAFYLDGVSLDDTAEALYVAGVPVPQIEDIIKSTGIKEGFVLTPEAIQAKVVEAVKGKEFAHYLDVVTLAKALDIKQLSEHEKVQVIGQVAKLSKSLTKEPAQFKKLSSNKGHYGLIATWVKDHPDFTAQELHASNLIDAPNSSDYYDQFLAFREFYKELYSL